MKGGCRYRDTVRQMYDTVYVTPRDNLDASQHGLASDPTTPPRFQTYCETGLCVIEVILVFPDSAGAVLTISSLRITSRFDRRGRFPK
jgi:hypothetical protein